MSQDMASEMKKIMNVKIKDVMRTQLTTVEAEENIENVAKKMTGEKTSCSLVMDQGKVIGIITERDITRRLIASSKDSKETKAKEIMSSPIIAVGEDALLADAALIMAKNKVRRLTVIDKESKLVGMVTASDLARTLAYQMKLENVLFNALAREPPPPSQIYE